VKLEELVIAVFSVFKHQDFRVLLGWTFSHLVRCSLGVTQGGQETMESFLIRHPMLRYLHIQEWYLLEVWPVAARISLPHLQNLDCSVKAIPSIVAHNLKEATLYWPDEEPHLVDIEASVAALKAMTHPDIPFVCANDVDDFDRFGEIVASIARHIPYTKTLQMRTYGLDSPQARFPSPISSRHTKLVYPHRKR
jgi:hypothetical protein